MSKLKNKSAFTLLEVIIVIIIIGVLASIALPRFFSTVEYSHASEALNVLSQLRQSMERCYMPNASYASCATLTGLDVDNPNATANAHFSYALFTTSNFFTVVATRNALDGGAITDMITIQTAGTKGGTSRFANIR